MKKLLALVLCVCLLLDAAVFRGVCFYARKQILFRRLFAERRTYARFCGRLVPFSSSCPNPRLEF